MKKKDWIPPRGISLKTYSERNLPHGVFWRTNGKRNSKYFDTKAKSVVFAKSLAKEKDRHGKLALSWSPREFQEWKLFKERINGADLEEVAKIWDRYGVNAGGKQISEMIDQFYAEKESEGIAHATLMKYKKHLERFRVEFGDYRLDSVSPRDLWSFLQDLNFAPSTVKTHRKSIGNLYSWAMEREYCMTNPSKLVKDKQEFKDIEILTVDQGKQFFEANRDTVAIGRFALEAFGCMRFSSAKRLVFSDINWEEKGITLPADRIKTRRRKYVDGYPENMWQWLKHAPDECWDLTERQFQHEKVKAFERADIPHPHNCFRHSGCTYHYAAFKNPGLTAILMTHTNLQTMEQYYRGRATQKQGLAWFNIRPR